VGVFGVHVALAGAPTPVEKVWGVVGPTIAWALSRVTGAVPFSVAEAALVVLAVLVLVRAVLGVVAVARGRRGAGNLLASGALVTLQVTGIIVGGFYLLWGFGYSRPAIDARLRWPDGRGAEVETLHRLAREALDATNREYRAIHGSDDAGTPTAITDVSALDGALEQGWRLAAIEVGLRGAVTRRTCGPIKQPPLLSRAMDWLGISGFYLPFTGEAHVNRGIPGMSWPMTAAHEKSHQRGINPENEANFFGFLVAACTPDPQARYAAWMFAHRQLVTALWAHDEDAARALVAARLPGVQRDVDDMRAYWERFEGPVRDASRRTNDAFLKTNRVEGGVTSYGRSVELMVAWAAARGGTLAGP
jgi:hypothetical protein